MSGAAKGCGEEKLQADEGSWYNPRSEGGGEEVMTVTTRAREMSTIHCIQCGRNAVAKSD